MTSAESLLPNFVILGAQKSASTYLSEVLRQHPDVYMPADEVRFFETPEYGDGDPAPLHALFHGHAQRLRGIRRPDYLARGEVPARIRQHLPDAKLIVVLREPVSRLVSAYYYYIKLGFLPPVHIEQGLPHIMRCPEQCPIKARELLSYGQYSTHLKRYLGHFARTQLLVVLQDDLAKAPAESMDKVYQFLGLAPLKRLPKVRRDNSGVYSLPRLRLLTQRNRFLYDYDEYGKLVGKTGTTRYLAAGAITALDRYFMAAILANDKPKLDANLVSELKTFYRPDVAWLQDFLGHNLKSWQN